MQTFGTILSIVLVISIFAVIGTAAALDNTSAGRIAGKQTLWIVITASAGWHWIRTIWKPFDANSADQLSMNKPQGFMGLKFGNNAKSSDQNRITQEKNSGNFLGLKFGGSAMQSAIQRDREKSRRISRYAKEEFQRVSEILGDINDPDIADMVSEFVPEKTIQNKSQREEGEYAFDQASRMFIPKRGRSTESTKESAPKEDGSFPKEKLQELKTAFDQGLIDTDEYSALKKQILGL